MSNKHEEDKESRAGLYTTLIFHLSVLIILLLVSIGSVADQEHSFVLDFTKQEEHEKEIKEIEMKEEAKRQIEELLGKPAETSIRNVAVDAGAKLRDNRGKTGEDVYKEARELQKRLDASKRDALREKSEAEAVDMGNSADKEDNEATAYKGPSVLSYSLDGRKGRYLPVPAYKGYGGGDVCVAIVVNPKGKVISAKVVESRSTGDAQLWEFAIDAAKRSRFSAKDDAPAQQQGEIVYRFIRQ